MKTKRIITLFIVFIISFSIYAQKQYRVRNINKCKLHRCMLIDDKKEFINKYMQLSPEESKLIWDLYETREQNIVHSRNVIKMAIKTKHSTEEECDQALHLILIENEKITKERNDFYLKLRKHISSDKILSFMHAEKEFKHQLIKQMECMRPLKDK